MGNEAYELQGRNGTITLDGGTGFTSFTGRSAGLLVITDVVLTSIAKEGSVNAGGIDGVTLQAGMFLGGVFTAVSWSSGGVVDLFPIDEDYVVA